MPGLDFFGLPGFGQALVREHRIPCLDRLPLLFGQLRARTKRLRFRDDFAQLPQRVMQADVNQGREQQHADRPEEEFPRAQVAEQEQQQPGHAVLNRPNRISRPVRR